MSTTYNRDHASQFLVGGLATTPGSWSTPTPASVNVNSWTNAAYTSASGTDDVIKNSSTWPGFDTLKSDWVNGVCTPQKSIGYTYCDYWAVLNPARDDKLGHVPDPTVELKSKYEDKREIMNCSTSNEIDISFMNDPLKNICFNKMVYAESPEIPTDDDGPNKMITFDYTGFVGRWNNKAGTDYTAYTTGIISITTANDARIAGDEL
jgi:hypothetical protein